MSEGKYKTKYLESLERIKSLEKSNRSLANENTLLERTIRTLNERYEFGLDFKRGTKFARQLVNYQNLRHLVKIADFFTINHTKLYDWYKEIMKTWCKADIKEAIGYIAGAWNLSIERAWCKMYLDMVYGYCKLYEMKKQEWRD